MNERIKELAEQAGWDNHHSKFDTRIEKFAELIVKETLQVARAGIAYGDGMEDAVYKYFGVEE
jgi:hypothetical protein